MKSNLLLCIIFLCTGILSGCAQSNAGDVPSLSPNRAPTSRMPSPGNIQGTNMMNAQMMSPVTR